ncbi:MAG: flagellar type III secretion system pore protein FliP [Planctomycetota bacterium]|nr:flagellar type III secretion system pore protein FliP [Planctomycetota bacterium]
MSPNTWGSCALGVCALSALFIFALPSSAVAQSIAATPPAPIASAAADPNAPVALAPDSPILTVTHNLPDLTKRENFSAAMQLLILLTVLSLAPAILLMMTSFTRIIIVLSLLRQAMGTQQLPPNQVLIGLAMFMTFLIMGPTWDRVNSQALAPYMNGQMTQTAALSAAIVPVREFMTKQIIQNHNESDVDLFMQFAHKPRARNWGDVGTTTLIPAYMLSELKTAFSLGFKVYLPFLIIDMVISSVLVSMGMMMLPPVLISLPFKLLLFVLVDGWRLIIGNLMGTFVT